MIDMPKKEIHITETVLRDARQSHAATRMRLSDMLPMCSDLDKVGYWSIECWGGATFDACLRYLDEDPWERLRQLKRKMPNTKLQMLLRGQNLLGYRHYSDDVVDLFCRKAIENGIDVIRVFDALNDIQNMTASISSIHKYGGICEAAMCYTKSPVHTQEYFVNMAVELERLGADLICIKDMANLLLPIEAYQLVKAIKEKVHLPIHLHTHNTIGTGDMVYLMAAYAGVDIVDCALAPFANGSSQPSTEAFYNSLRSTPRCPSLNADLMYSVSGKFEKLAAEMESEGVISSKVLRTMPKTLLYQIPGGMLSNLLIQLKDMNAQERIDEVLQEVPKVRADFGYPPLVTPTSQIIGTQAVLNILSGKRYSVLSKESHMLLRGEYGNLPAKPDPNLVALAEKEARVITEGSADSQETEIEDKRREYASIVSSDEDLLSCIMFPKIAPEFLSRKKSNVIRQKKLIVKCDMSAVDIDGCF